MKKKTAHSLSGKRGLFSFISAVLALMIVFPVVLKAEGNELLISENVFPDEVFRNYVQEHFDADGSGTLSEEEIAAVTSIDVSGKRMESLEGIAYFTELRELNANNTGISDLSFVRPLATHIPMQENLEVLLLDHTTIKDLELRYLPNLRVLSLNEAGAQRLDLSGNPNLEMLTIDRLYIDSLDLSRNEHLRYLSAGRLRTLKDGFDLSRNPRLEELHLPSCELDHIDLSHNRALRTLDLSGNHLTEVDLSGQQGLESLTISANPNLTLLDLSANPELRTLICSSLPVKNLDLSNLTKLEKLDISLCKPETLDLRNLTQLKSLHCAQCELETLDLSHNTALEFLDYNDNHITNLNLDHLPNLNSIQSGGNNYRIDLDPDSLSFDLASLPGAFEPARAEWRDAGISVEGTVLSLDKEAFPEGNHLISYSYLVHKGNDLRAQVKLSFDPNVLIEHSDETEPEPTEPSETEPEVTEPSETEPVETEPEITEPSETEPSETEADVTEPSETEPEVTEPEIQWIRDAKSEISVAVQKDILQQNLELIVDPIHKVREDMISREYDIYFTKDNEEYQLNVPVKVRIPYAAPLKKEGLKVFHDTGKKLIEIEAYIADDYVEFTADHFSIYILANPVTGEVKPGDESKADDGKTEATKAASDKTKTEAQLTKTGETGEHTVFFTVTGTLALAAAVIVIIIRKRKENIS